MEDKELAPDTTTSDNTELVGWVMSRVQRWRNVRDQNYKESWDKFYGIWTGKWAANLSAKSAERSKLIAPATQNAIDQTVSEMVEATFGRGKWFDISDDASPQEQQVAEMIRDNLIDDFDRDRMSSRITDVYYNGAIFGTGIAKRVVERGSPNRVYWDPIRPYNFVIDTAATSIEEALGCAHEDVVPRHVVEQKQDSGEYQGGDVGESAPPAVNRGYSSDIINLQKGIANESFEIDPEDGVYITEYHGLVPSSLLNPKKADPDKASEDSEVLANIDTGDDDEDDLVEAIVVIGNGSTLLKAVENPIMDDHGKPDRGFVAYQHHKRPNAFWGIGQAEKAFNAQVALDGELRARMDSLAIRTYPVMGADATRLPKNLNLQITPGKLLLTNGQPNEIIQPITFGNLDPVSFQQSGDFERMVQVATGASDPATPVNVNSKNTTASGVSMQASAFIKRAKLTMQNVDSDFLDPMVRKSLFAYMAVSPDRYPQAADFVVNSTMSIMAREFEQAQMTNLLAIIPQESGAFPIILKGIVENYSGPSKDKIIAAIDKMSQPDPQQQQMQQQAQMMAFQKMQAELQLIQAQIQEVMTRAQLNNARAGSEGIKAQHSVEDLHLRAADTVIKDKQTDVQAMQTALKAKELHVNAHLKVADMASKERQANMKAKQQKGPNATN